MPLLAFLRERLDGNHTLRSLIDSRPDAISAESVLKALKILHEYGVIVSRDALIEPDVRPQAATWPSYLRDTAETFWGRKLGVTGSAVTASSVEERIRRASIVLVQGGLVGLAMQELLEAVGVRKQTVIPLDEGGLPAATAGVDEVAPDDQTRVDAFRSAVVEATADADMLVVGVHAATWRLREIVNEAALRCRRPLVFANDDGERAEITFIDPYRSACLVCMDLRQSLVSEFALEDYLFRADTNDQPRLAGAYPKGESITTAALIASHAVGEVTRHFSRGAPHAFVNAVLWVDGLSGLSQLSSVLRIPRCPACSPAPMFGEQREQDD